MISYFAIFSARMRMQLQYRVAALAGFGTQLFWGMIRVMIFGAFYRSSVAPQPMTLEEVVAYIWLGQAMFGMLPWRPDTEIRQMIRTGTVSYELVRPLNLYAFWYSRALAERIAPTLLRSIPMLILVFLFFDLSFPPSWPSAVAWLVSTAAAFLLSAGIAMLLTISLLWTIDGEGIAQMAPAAVFLLSGMIVPLPLFPDWCQPLLNILPFGGLVDTPFRLYLGHIPPEQALYTIAHQLTWAFGFVVFGQWLLSRSTARLVVQGG